MVMLIRGYIMCLLDIVVVNFINIREMTNTNYPIPYSHRTLEFGNVVIDSDFDSGNLFNAEKNGHNNVRP